MEKGQPPPPHPGLVKGQPRVDKNPFTWSRNSTELVSLPPPASGFQKRCLPLRIRKMPASWLGAACGQKVSPRTSGSPPRRLPTPSPSTELFFLGWKCAQPMNAKSSFNIRF